MHYDPGRPFALDMAGFAVSLAEYLKTPSVGMVPDPGQPETVFLVDMGYKIHDVESVAYDFKDVLAYHTKLVKPDISAEDSFKTKHGHASDSGFTV